MVRLIPGTITGFTEADRAYVVWGIVVKDVIYVRGDYVSGPTAGTKLLRYIVPAGRRAYILALLADGTASASFTLSWVSNGAPLVYKLRLPGSGVVSYVFTGALNPDTPADSGTEIAVTINESMPLDVYKIDMRIGLV